jgi:hypothetical integral membrane protein (TIGR02206 family)
MILAEKAVSHQAGGSDMGTIFHFNAERVPFEFFSIPHTAALVVIGALLAVIYIFRKTLAQPSVDRLAIYAAAVILIMFEAGLYIWYFAYDEWSVDATLPFQLCSLTFMLSVVMLLTKSYALYEFNYFAGIGGALQALLTPAAILSGFPHFTYYYFFVAHGGIVLAAMYMTWVTGYRPQFKSIWKTLLYLNIYMIFILGINRITGGNYLFLTRKPPQASLLDYLGPWPWYIVWMEVAAVVTFLILYLPFAVKDWIRSRRNTAYK